MDIVSIYTRKKFYKILSCLFYFIMIHFNDHKTLFLILMTYLIVLKLYIVTEHEMILSDFYEVCQLQNGLNPLGPYKLMLLLWSRCFTNPSKSWFFNDLGPLGTPLKLKLHPNYVVLESTRVIITICFLIVLVTQFQMLVSCVVFCFPIYKII